MRNILQHITVLLLVVSLMSGCGESSPPDAMDSAETDTAIESVSAPELELLIPPDMLEGHSWKAGDVTFSFQSGGHALVRGGHLADTMPSGAPARYTLEDERLSIEVLGRVYEGSWDGHTLIISEKPAEYIGDNKRILN